MKSQSIVTRAIFVLCGGIACSAMTAQASAADAVLETRPVPPGAEKVIVEATGAYGLDQRSIQRHLASSLTTGSMLPPRNDALSSFDGRVLTKVQRARPAIGSPFGSEETVVVFPKLGNLQYSVRRPVTN
ncbi:hypothetical protein [Variovorax sp. LT1R16]|uniref:hypothetical protein n=1 Tax=Variovorax sp. LT1R16 TaxID=3443728 RepID=UPI003F48F797